MVIGGLWHGAGFTFIIWGALHGLFLIVNHTWLKLRKRSTLLARVADTSVYELASLVLTQVCALRLGSFSVPIHSTPRASCSAR